MENLEQQTDKFVKISIFTKIYIFVLNSLLLFFAIVIS